MNNIGRRVYPPEPNEEFEHPLPLDLQPYDYWFDKTLGYWMIYCPNGGVGNLIKHNVIEHDDGTITVSPSILVTTHFGGSWHGYIERGIWKDA